ncbi:MAG: glycoside hydrolase family 57 protein [Candidatus Micrarchaeia archaeon]|jgi:alpha-amylase
MADICLYFHVHQPVRMRKLSLLSQRQACDAPALEGAYFDDASNRHYFEKAARQCYTPANNTLAALAKEHGDAFRFSFSITGVFLEQAKKFDKSVLESFQKVAATGNAEILGETYYHSLASLYNDKAEFREQVKMHAELVWDLFGQKPKSFRNTEVIYNNSIAAQAQALGYKAIISEGIERVLGWRSPNYVYAPKGCGKIRLLLRNYKLSDDVGYRFSAKWWPQWPLTAGKYASWLAASPGQVINLFMDYETFGEHHWADTGILDFLRAMPGECLKHGNLSFNTIGGAAEKHEAVGEIDVQADLSWADLERDTSTWVGNNIQRTCFAELESLEPKVRAAGDAGLLHIWRMLQTSDHLMYLCTKSWADGDVHKYFSPYKENTPYDNFINYMNVIQDFKMQVQAALDAREIEKENLREIPGAGTKRTETSGDIKSHARHPSATPS